MKENITGRIFMPRELYGSDEYSITVEITNLTDSPITINSIVPELIPGKILFVEESEVTSEIDNFEEQKRKLVKELEMQVEEAYDIIYRKTKTPDKIFYTIIAVASLFSVSSEDITDNSRPNWANQALKVNEWSDVEQLDSLLISKLDDDSFLKKAFAINKGKLRKCLDNILEMANTNEEHQTFDAGLIISPKDSITIPYRCVAPYVYSMKICDIHFSVFYKNEKLDIQGSYPVRESAKIFASKGAIVYGAIVGAVLGFAVKNTLVNSFVWFDKAFWSTLFGSITLAVIFGVSTARSAESKKILTVENFAGGILIGALCALFSTRLVEYLAKLIPS